uniref:T9L6.7 protein n=1 Tax=Arabidopsis thaliana TaxID=3702 RepID=Q9LP28_ARATH|nr:Hypothetical Protein [Arabidopsis thaliana]
MGIPLVATLATVLQTHRSRRHRAELYNKIEAEIQRLQQQVQEAEKLVQGRLVPLLHAQVLLHFVARNTQQTFNRRSHQNMELRYSSEVWENLAQRLLSTDYSSHWNHLIAKESALPVPRNARRHGELSLPSNRLIKLIDKTVRNRISSIRDTGNHSYNTCLQLWFSTRPRSSLQLL